MAFCAKFDKRSKYLFDIDELIIPFHGDFSTISEFLEEHKNQRIIIDFKDQWEELYLDALIELQKQYSNFVLRFNELKHDIVAILYRNHIPYFSSQIVVEWELLNELLEEQVSDIYIGEQLGFELDKIAGFVGPTQTRIRVFPNVAQSARKDTDSLKKFFIRPEDIDLYNQRYVSTFEFFIPDNLDLNVDVLYRAYAINHYWHGPLYEIILGLNTDLNNIFLSPHWSELRMNCGRKCLKGHPCNMCNLLYDFSKSLAKLEVKPVILTDSKNFAKKMMAAIDSKEITSSDPFPEPQIREF